MKRYKIYTLIILLFVTGYSCTDLEEEPVGLLAPEAMFKTTKDVETAVMGAYGRMAAEQYFGRKLTLTLQLWGDMCDIGDRGTPSRRQHINDFAADPNNGMITSLWPRSYEIVSAVNAGLDGADRIEASEDELSPIKAEARFIRAFVYYHLVRIFGDIPYIDFFVSDPNSVKEVSKTSAAEVYVKIKEDLEYAKQNLPDSQPNGTRARPTKATAAAYLASVALTLGDYNAAYTEAKWVITNSDMFDVDLMADYQDLFNATIANGLKEHLFVVDFAAGLSDADWMAPVTGIRGSDDKGWSVSVPSMAVYNSWDDRDYRKQVAMDDTTLVGGEPIPYTEFQNTQRPHIAKFMRFYGNSRGDGGASDNNYVAMRYAEVLLIAAEAINEMNGPTDEAVGYINQIRARARNWAGTQTDFPEDILEGVSKDDFRSIILEERRLELSFEYKRWYDIKRLDIGEEVFKGANSLEPHANFDSGKHYLLPIPQTEIDLNPNLLPQNAGY